MQILSNMKVLQIVVFSLLYHASVQVESKNITIKDVPYQAYLESCYDPTKENDPFSCSMWKPCGGSVISEYHVLTSQYCLTYRKGKEPSGVAVYLGINNRGERFTQKAYGCPYMRKQAPCWVNHPGYNAVTGENDLSIIKSKTKIVFSDTIQLIPLPSLSDENLDLTEKTAVISGWDKTYKPEPYSELLRVAKITINTKCPQKIKETEICSVLGSDGVCIGQLDTGGPLAIDEKLFGIISVKNCELNGYALFTNVVKYLKWIKENTANVTI